MTELFAQWGVGAGYHVAAEPGHQGPYLTVERTVFTPDAGTVQLEGLISVGRGVWADRYFQADDQAWRVAVGPLLHGELGPFEAGGFLATGFERFRRDIGRTAAGEGIYFDAAPPTDQVAEALLLRAGVHVSYRVAGPLEAVLRFAETYVFHEDRSGRAFRRFWTLPREIRDISGGIALQL